MFKTCVNVSSCGFLVVKIMVIIIMTVTYDRIMLKCFLMNMDTCRNIVILKCDIPLFFSHE